MCVYPDIIYEVCSKFVHREICRLSTLLTKQNTWSSYFVLSFISEWVPISWYEHEVQRYKVELKMDYCHETEV